MEKKWLKLYNVIFPIWFILLFIPTTWIIILPSNFLIDASVLLLTMKHLKITNKMQLVKKVILKTWVAGFVADFIGTAAMFLSILIQFKPGTALAEWWNENISIGVSFNPFQNIFSFLWVTMCILISAYCIYLFNDKVCLRKLNIEMEKKRKLAISMAVFTAPYLFYLPTNLFI